MNNKSFQAGGGIQTPDPTNNSFNLNKLSDLLTFYQPHNTFKKNNLIYAQKHRNLGKSNELNTQ